MLNQSTHNLTCHPDTPSQEVHNIYVLTEQTKHGSLILTYRLSGDIPALSIPKPASPQRADNLWQHTCFEAFMMVNEGPEYRELNFSPSGEWAVYDFSDYRVGRHTQSLLTAHSPGIKVTCDDDTLELIADIPNELLIQGEAMKLGLSAVIESNTGEKSYWALKHPSEKPDFHHKDSFIVQV